MLFHAKFIADGTENKEQCFNYYQQAIEVNQFSPASPASLISRHSPPSDLPRPPESSVFANFF
jgi:hypothetical protein